MNEAFDFIPGFLPTLLRSPAALQARERLVRTVETGHLTPRQRARIALIVAQQSGSEYCLWAQTCMARRAGLRWEEIVFSSMGTALGPRDAAIAALAILDNYLIAQHAPAAPAKRAA